MKILITGTTGIAEAIANVYNDCEVICVSRSTGHNIDNVECWGADFIDYDMLVNCAHSSQSQVNVLQYFARAWQDNKYKTIVSIGSKVIDHARTELSKDSEFWPYRYDKIILQKATNDLLTYCKCDIRIYNPGPVDTPLISHLDIDKMNVDTFAKTVRQLNETPHIKRVDLWK